MKRLYLYLAISLLFSAQLLWAQQATLNYQGVLREASGRAVEDGDTYQLTFKLYNVETGGTSIWTETHNNVNVKNGVFSADLGTVNSLSGLSFSETYYLGITVGNDNEMVPRTRLTTAPYALSLWGADNKFPSSGNVGIGTTSPAIHLAIGDTDTGLKQQGDGQLGIFTNNTERIRIDSAGKVGIGTTTPGASLFIARSSDPANQWNQPESFDHAFEIFAGNDAYLYMGVGDGDNNAYIQSVGDATTADLVLNARGGDVGINTNNPAISLAIGDTDTGLEWVSDGNLSIRTNNVERMRFEPDGNVGIGAIDPNYRLHVQANISGAGMDKHVALIENMAGDGADGLAIYIHDGSSDTDNNFITFYEMQSGAEQAIGAIEGTSTFDIHLVSGSGDFAECLPRINPGEVIEAGEIVGVFEGQITKNTTNATHVMAVTDQSIVLGNSPGDDQRHLYEDVSFVGQVPIKIDGPINAGDYVIPSGNNDGIGIARSPEEITPEQYAQIVGICWETSSHTGVKRVNTAIGVNTPEKAISHLMKKAQKQEAELKALKAQLSQIQAVLKDAKLLDIDHADADR